MHFATIANWLEPAKLQYACSAHYLDHIDTINLTAEQQAFLGEIPDQMFREAVRDFMVNQQFRRDYWIRGARRLTPLEQVEVVRVERVVLTSDPSTIKLKVNGSLGEATLNQEIYEPIIAFLSDHNPRSILEIEQALHSKQIRLAQIVQAVIALSGAGHVHPVQAEELTKDSRHRSTQLNRILMKKSYVSSDIAYLVSPLTGGGLMVGRFPQLFSEAVMNNHKTASALAEYVWKILASQGQRVVKDGKPLESQQENLAELKLQAENYLEKQVPLLRSLGVV